MNLLTEQKLRELVEKFYQRVRADAALGPVFEGAIENWDHHLQLLTNFWHGVMLTSGRYKGNPMQAHYKHVASINPAMFGRWLGLWEQAAFEVLEPDQAELIVSKAKRIAVSLQLGLFHGRSAA